jgi:hypothetical protein
VLHTHPVGRVTYADDTEGTLMVVRLGLSDRSPDHLHDFPAPGATVSTSPDAPSGINAQRFDAYQFLGIDNGSDQ